MYKSSFTIFPSGLIVNLAIYPDWIGIDCYRNSFYRYMLSPVSPPATIRFSANHPRLTFDLDISTFSDTLFTSFPVDNKRLEDSMLISDSLNRIDKFLLNP